MLNILKGKYTDMKTTRTKTIQVVIILITTGLLTFFCINNFRKEKIILPNVVDTVIIRDTVIDTLFVNTTTYVPRVIYRDTGSYLVRESIVDTSQVLRDFFTRYAIIDTIINDSNAKIIITDTLYKNMIISRNPVIRLYNRKIETQTISIIQSRRGLYAGVMACGNKHKLGLGVSFQYTTPGKSSLGLSYDIINKQVFVSYSWHLF